VRGRGPRGGGGSGDVRDRGGDSRPRRLHVVLLQPRPGASRARPRRRGRAVARSWARDRPREEPLPQILWRQVRGKVIARRGDLQEGERLAREAVALADETDMLNAHGDALTDLAEVLALAGQDARGSSTERSRSTSGRATSSWRSARDRDWRSSRRRGKSRSRRRTSLTVRKGRRLR